MACLPNLEIKPGDTIPIGGRIVVQELDADNVYQDITDTIDFTLWTVTSALRTRAGAVVVTPIVTFTGPVYYGEISSAQTAGLIVGDIYLMDTRFRDELGQVRSTKTVQIKIVAAQAGVP